MNSTNGTVTVIPQPSVGYVDALQVCAAILLMILAGFLWRVVRRVPDHASQAMNSYMFLVGIPALVFQGLAVQKFASLPWSYVGVFFCLRITLFLLWVVVDIQALRRKELGIFVADWMNSTWINTIIFGLPIYVALYGKAAAVYPIFASISSFFFQLPVQLFFFEVDAVLASNNAGVSKVKDSDKKETITGSSAIASSFEKMDDSKEKSDAGGVVVVFDGMSPLKYPEIQREWDANVLPVLTRIQWQRLILKMLFEVVLNPIMIAILGGIFWSLTGWELPLFLSTFCTYCGNAVTPLAAFSIGVFMFRPLPRDFRLWISFSIQIVVKIYLMPLLVMPYAIAFDLRGAPRQMAVLMSALPVALSCYVLSLQYHRNEQLSSWMIIVSTVLMLPVQIMWIAITDSMGWGV